MKMCVRLYVCICVYLHVFVCVYVCSMYLLTWTVQVHGLFSRTAENKMHRQSYPQLQRVG